MRGCRRRGWPPPPPRRRQQRQRKSGELTTEAGEFAAYKEDTVNSTEHRWRVQGASRRGRHTHTHTQTQVQSQGRDACGRPQGSGGAVAAGSRPAALGAALRGPQHRHRRSFGCIRLHRGGGRQAVVSPAIHPCRQSTTCQPATRHNQQALASRRCVSSRPALAPVHRPTIWPARRQRQAAGTRDRVLGGRLGGCSSGGRTSSPAKAGHIAASCATHTHSMHQLTSFEEEEGGGGARLELLLEQGLGDSLELPARGWCGGVVEVVVCGMGSGGWEVSGGSLASRRRRPTPAPALLRPMRPPCHRACAP